MKIEHNKLPSWACGDIFHKFKPVHSNYRDEIRLKTNQYCFDVYLRNDKFYLTVTHLNPGGFVNIRRTTLTTIEDVMGVIHIVLGISGDNSKNYI